MITVLHLCEHFGGQDSSLHGPARAFQLWLPRFDVDRFRVLLCSRKAGDKAAEMMERSGIRPLYLGYGKFDPRNATALIKLVRAEGVQIIHAHGYGSCLWGRIVGCLLGIPVIVHGRANYGSVPLYMRPIEWMLGRITRHGFAVSESTRQFMIKKRYMPAGAIEVLYNGIDISKSRRSPPERLQKLKTELAIDNTWPVLGIVSRLESYKGHLDAINAFPVVRKALPEAVLLIAGDGTFRPELEQRVKELELEDAVRFLGFREDVLDVIQVFDIQVFPSHQEGTPNALLEAMALGRTIAASTADGQGEILTDGRDALTFAPGDTAAMAEKIITLANDGALRDRLAAAALNRAADFNVNRVVKTMEETYERIASAPHR